MDALPWYKSPVYVSQVVTAVSAFTALVPKAAVLLGLTSPDAINQAVSAIFGVIALAATVYGAAKRKNSSVQPLTLTQTGADNHPATLANKQGGFVRPLMLACLLVVAGCASLGLTAPKGFDQQLAEAYSIHTAVVEAVAGGYQAGKISDVDARAVQKMEVNARGILDAARSAESAGDTATANSKLALALTSLTALQTYLNTYGANNATH